MVEEDLDVVEELPAGVLRASDVLAQFCLGVLFQLSTAALSRQFPRWLMLQVIPFASRASR
ncbi:MAG: hypothetical protein FJ086_00720 [Deltaproteobacteria bacterium]|nr:hypothetical protein [Deltaproteobacteria bacterium]